MGIGQTPERNCAKLPNGESEMLIVKMLIEGFAIARPLFVGHNCENLGVYKGLNYEIFGKT